MDFSPDGAHKNASKEVIIGHKAIFLPYQASIYYKSELFLFTTQMPWLYIEYPITPIIIGNRMKHLFAPWREEYSKSIERTKLAGTPEEECVFCAIFKEHNDAQNFILRRFPSMVIMLNRYPYNAGHIMILPTHHVASLSSLGKESRLELMELTNASIEIIKTELACDGVNVGLNLGKAAGAGIPSHLHMHILPRYFGDTNFLPTLADTKQISFDLNKIYARLKPAFDTINI